MEFALVLPVILLTIVLIVEVAAVSHTQLVVTSAAREGVRIAATTPDTRMAVDGVRTALGERADDARITIHRPDVVGRPAEVVVSIRHVVGAMLGGVGVEVRGRASMRVER